MPPGHVVVVVAATIISSLSLPVIALLTASWGAFGAGVFGQLGA